ncbi:MAG: hypothetical protein MHMPM18_005194 [Marteilia pararefringens]
MSANPSNPSNSNRKTRRIITDESRTLMINHSSNGMSNSTIAQLMCIPRSTVATIVSKYNSQGTVNGQKRGGNTSSKLTNSQKNSVLSWIDCDAALTLKQLVARVATEFGVTVGTSTIERCINEFHYSLKLTTIVPERRNTPKTIDQRHTYASRFNDLLLNGDDTRFVFLDEVGFAVSTRPRRGRSPIGTSAYVSTSAIRTRNISVIAAMNKYGMIDHVINDRPVNGEDFKSYLLTLKGKCNDNRINNPIFILDNARIHHYSGVKQLIETEEMEVIYLPPYSPFLNPIENGFSKWKNFVTRGGATNELEVKNLINEGFGSVSQSDCEGYFRKMTRYVARSLARETILE